jgi:hypothetical protein
MLPRLTIHLHHEQRLHVDAQRQFRVVVQQQTTHCWLPRALCISTIRRRATSSTMSIPLVDIDANPRQSGFKPTEEVSKIPSPPNTRLSGSASRRNPFSVSSTGSPRYVAMPALYKPVTSSTSTPTSKLPRKSTPTQSAYSKNYTYSSRPVALRKSLSRSPDRQKRPALATPSRSVCLHRKRLGAPRLI